MDKKISISISEYSELKRKELILKKIHLHNALKNDYSIAADNINHLFEIAQKFRLLKELA